MRVLIVEDEPKVVGFLKKGLEEENWSVATAYNGIEALIILRDQEFDILILDIMMPKMDGLTLLKQIRQEGNKVPVLFLTAKDAISERVSGLRSGADDYLVKPFAFEELLARMQALVRRNKWEEPEKLQIADLIISIDNHTVTRKEQQISLSPLEFRILELLARNQGRAMSREAIEDYIWGRNESPDTNAVDVYINFLRKKIDKPFAIPLIKTVRSIGYKIEGPADAF